MLANLGFRFVATAGTAAALKAVGVPVERVVERLGGDGLNAIELMTAGEITLVINTPRGRGARADGAYIRTAAAQHGIPLLTTVAAAQAAALGLSEARNQRLFVRSLQDIHRTVR